MGTSGTIDHGSHHGRDPAIIAPQAIAVAIATVLVCMRIHARNATQRLWWDDLLVILGLMFTIVELSIVFVGTRHGVGTHQKFLTPQQQNEAAKWILVSNTAFGLGAMFTRVSIAFLPLRICPIKKVWQRLLYAIIGFIVATSLLCISLVGLYRPARKILDPNETVRAIGLSLNGATAILTDLTLACLPTVLLRRIPMTFWVKLGVCGLTGLGFLSTACAIVHAVLASTLDRKDTTCAIIRLTVWATLEVTIGIIAACIPTLQPLFRPRPDAHRSHGYNSSSSIITKPCAFVPASNELQHSRDKSQYCIMQSRERDTLSSEAQDTDGTTAVSNPAGITKTTEIRVSTRLASDSDEALFMRRITPFEKVVGGHEWGLDGR